MASTSALDHPTLGRLKGVVRADGKVVQYRNLKFGNIPGRFQHSTLAEAPLSEDEYDATKYGPLAPQPPFGFGFDLSLVGNVSLPNDHLTYSEFDCLNATVTVPNVEGKKLSDLPVMHWIHGGAWVTGGNAWPQTDMSNLVAKSVEMGMPVIIVQCQYRLSTLGFLAIEELGLTGNYGLKDQILGFEWVHKHISGFGGSPNNITAFGESAGSISVGAHLLLGKEGSFSKAILMSGDITMYTYKSLTEQSESYKGVLKGFGIDVSSKDETIKKLLEIPYSEIIEKQPFILPYVPTIDGDLIKEPLDTTRLYDPKDSYGKPSWCPEIVIGDTAHDGTIFLRPVPGENARVREAVKRALGASEGQTIIDTYKMGEDQDEKQQTLGRIELITDLVFHLAVLRSVKARADGNHKVYRYHFHQRNPVEGNTKGISGHTIEVNYLLKNLKDHIPASDDEFIDDIWIKFVNGKGWPGSGDGKQVVVLGPDHLVTVVDEEEYDKNLKSGRGRLLLDMGFDKTRALTGEVVFGA